MTPLLVVPATQLHAADGAQLRYGRHLASECTSCHAAGGKGSDGGKVSDGAIPALAGRPAAEIGALLADYREGRKTNPVMVSVAQSLDPEQTAAVAAYFASLPALPASPSRR